MERQTSRFPFEFKELEPEERAELIKLYNSPDIDYKVVGPQKYKLRPLYVEDAANIYNLQIRPSDVFVTSYPRSGTTWTQELVWLIANDLDYAKAKAIPLVERYQFLEIFTLFGEKWKQVYLENAIDKEKASKIIAEVSTPVSRKLATLPSPRFIKTHMPMSLLPPNLLDTAKVVYVARDPRDVAVSSFHHTALFKVLNFPSPFKDFWNLFIKDLHLLTPIFEHVKEAWALRHHPNMLFLFYEELSQNLRGSAKRVAHFLGKDVTDEEMDRLCEHLTFDNFKNNASVNLQGTIKTGIVNNRAFIRKGKAGGWRDYFDEEMTQQAERWIADNLKDTDLRFPHM